MRFIETAAAFYIGAVASAQDPTAPASSHGEREGQVDVAAVRVVDAISAEATRRHDRDLREDAPVGGRECIPSPLWAKEVDPAAYEIGCEEIEVGGSTAKIHRSIVALRSCQEGAFEQRCDTSSHRRWPTVGARFQD